MTLWFERPLLLLCLIPLVVLFVWLGRRSRRTQAAIELMPSVLRTALVNSQPWRGGYAARLLWLVLASALVVALSSPKVLMQSEAADWSKATWIVVVDLSAETLAAPQSVKSLQSRVNQLVESKNGAAIGLVALAGSAHWVLPPTQDVTLLKRYLYALDASLMPLPGWDFQAALTLLSKTSTFSDGAPIILITTQQRALQSVQRLSSSGLNAPILTWAWDSDVPAQSIARSAVALVQGERGGTTDLAPVVLVTALVVLLWLGRRQWAQALAASIVILSFGPFTPMTGPAAAADLSQRPDAEAEPSEWLEDTVTLLADTLFTPDQQGYWLQYFGYLELAADRYETPLYRGYALYRSGQFRQAARVLQQVDSMQARFVEGNAWARASDYRKALLAYDKALAIAPEQMEIQHNRDRVLALVEAAFEQGESQMADLGDVNTVEAVDGEWGTEATDDDMALLQTLESSRLLSDPAALARWRAQVEASPARFLASRFKAEWLREQGAQDVHSDP